MLHPFPSASFKYLHCAILLCSLYPRVIFVLVGLEGIELFGSEIYCPSNFVENTSYYLFQVFLLPLYPLAFHERWTSDILILADVMSIPVFNIFLWLLHLYMQVHYVFLQQCWVYLWLILLNFVSFKKCNTSKLIF